MSDLINRQQAIDALEEQLDYLFMLNKKDNPTAESKWYGVNWARNTIAGLPTIDLVRCGECKHYEHEICRLDPFWERYTEPNDFCSQGERRADDPD